MTGGLALFHAHGITPEVKTNLLTISDKAFTVKHDILRSDLKKMEEELTTSCQEVDLVALGCPLYSIHEVRFVTELVEGRKISSNIPLWIYTSPYGKWICKQQGYLDILTRAGVTVLTGTCPVISFLKFSGVRNVMLDSARAAHLIPSEHGIIVVYRSTRECIATSIRGRTGG